MTLTWIDAQTPLPDTSQALPGGLVAVGADLTTERLAEAYGKGIFPWFNPGDPVLWWSPDPRMILPCAALRCSRSLTKQLRRIEREERHPDGTIRVTLNTAFPTVIRACAQRDSGRVSLGAARAGGAGGSAIQRVHANDGSTTAATTWITPDIIDVYEDWHRQGRVHSVETWVNGHLVGGLYGVALGRFFFGESMFSRASDASKVALAYLVRYLRAWQVPYIDCQQETSHLASLGATPVPRELFLARLNALKTLPGPPWGRGQLLADGRLLTL